MYLPEMQQVHYMEVKEVVDMVVDEMVGNPKDIDLAQLGKQCFVHIAVRLEELTYFYLVLMYM